MIPKVKRFFGEAAKQYVAANKKNWKYVNEQIY